MQLNGEIAAGRSTVAEAFGAYDPFPHRRRRPVFEEITLALRKSQTHTPLLTENHTHVILAQPTPDREHSRPQKTPAT